MNPRKLSPSEERAYSMAERCYGNIRVVEFGEDFRVRIVSANAHLNVSVKDFPEPSGVGEWHFVQGFEKWKVKFVDSGEDFTIRFAPFGGLNR